MKSVLPISGVSEGGDGEKIRQAMRRNSEPYKQSVDSASVVREHCRAVWEDCGVVYLKDPHSKVSLLQTTPRPVFVAAYAVPSILAVRVVSGLERLNWLSPCSLPFLRCISGDRPDKS